MPILYREQVQQTTADISHSSESYCLITSLCAFMLIQPGIVLKTSHALGEQADSVTNPKMGTVLMEECTRVRKSYDYVENPTVNTVITSFFLFGCCFGLNRHNTGWLHLREATALAQILGMQDENTYMFDNVVETSRKRRLFWLLFVTERQVIFLDFMFVPRELCHPSDKSLTEPWEQGICIAKAPTSHPPRDHWPTNRRPRLVQFTHWFHPPG